MEEEYDVVIIGAGPGGYVAAIRAAQLGFKVACIDKNKDLGGTCLNVGCIPSKTLLHASELYSNLMNHGKELGLDFQKPGFDFSAMMQRKQKVVAGFNLGISGLFKKNKITSIIGEASFVNATTLKVGEKEIKAKNIILATGSEPIPLPFLPFDEKKILSSTGALALDKVPEKLIVVGAGVIGVELGSVYNRLGSSVTFVEFLDRVCPSLDESLSKAAETIFTKQGMKFYLSSKVTGGSIQGDKVTLSVGEMELTADAVLVSIGRRPSTKGLGLEKVGIVPDPRGFIPINGSFRTSLPNIYAIGDIVDGPMLAHKASEEGTLVAEIIAGKSPTLNYMTIPNVVYTFPEIAGVGLTEKETKEMGLSVKVGTFPFKANSRAKCTNEDDGFVKIIADSTTDKILGIHIIGPHASELISAASLAILSKMTAEELGSSCQAHPTLAEALKEASLDVHKRAIHK